MNTKFPHYAIDVCEKCQVGRPMVLVSNCNHIICDACKKSGACCGKTFTLDDVKNSDFPLAHYIAAATERQNETMLNYILKKTGDRTLFDHAGKRGAWYKKTLGKE